ncbi:M23 family metallopeptidase [Aminipila terrae]|uniref:Peptidoglycan DD-metalloendopeptidase family protein n=1 Tax=Aminipila terrae TaxID=2697030 RepID=A0A6P1MCX1_9FIRM|nr:M23 family metallopeptidase [Aminipila terrae]QHI71872.1 peptidoglycan DD-metalloendopeptidase family protein [Aminipila terrae]
MRHNIKDKKPMDKAAIALILCFSVVALASVFTVKSSLDKINLSDNTDITVPQKNETKDKSVAKRVPTVDSQDNPQSNIQNQNNGNSSSPSTWVVPVDGLITLEYSTELPIYSKTLNQYMVHNGVDIAAPLDSRVQAAAAGTVVETYKDDRLGYTVKINHGNGFITTYSNLSDKILVESGDVVKKGDVIGGIGDTSLFESADDSHLHFQMEKDGSLVNPSDYIDF